MGFCNKMMARCGWLALMLVMGSTVAWAGDAGGGGGKLAVLTVPGSKLAEELPGALTLQGKYTLADAMALENVFKEHPLFLTAKTSAADVAEFGKLLTAEYLLAVYPGEKGEKGEKDKQGWVRLVDCRTGAMVSESALALSGDAFLAAAAVREAVMPTVNPADPKPVPAADAKEEMANWRKYAQSLMPQSLTPEWRSPFPVRGEVLRKQVAQAAGAWERVLLLDPKDNEALLNAGVCLVSLVAERLNSNSPAITVDAQMALQGTRLVEAAFLEKPNTFNGATYNQLIELMERRLPERALQMQEFVVDHAKDIPERMVKLAREVVLRKNPQRVSKAIEEAVANVKGDPQTVAESFYETLLGAYDQEPRKRIDVAAPYTKSKNAVVRFFAEYVVTQTLRRLKDAEALEHYGRMAEALEEAYAELPKNASGHGVMDTLYKQWYETCVSLGQSDAAKKALLAGADHYKAAGRFNVAIAETYCLAVTQALGESPEDVKRALTYCEAYLTAKSKSLDGGDEQWAQRVAEYRQVHLAMLAGQKVPDFSALTLIAGTEGVDLDYSRIAAANGKIWLVQRVSGGVGQALMLDPAEDKVTALSGMDSKQNAVAAVGTRVFFGGSDGLYEVDAQGKVIWYSPMVGMGVRDVCAAGDNLMFAFKDPDGLWRVNLRRTATGRGFSLMSREPPAGMAPVTNVNRVWYNAAEDKILASTDGTGPNRESWTYEKDAWVKYEASWMGSDAKATLAAISQGSEALTITAENKGLVLRMKDCKEITLPQPYVRKVIEPAWDKERVYLPTYTGLYVVSRATGEKTWLAYQKDTPAYAAVVLGQRVYVMTARGLYRYEMGK